MSEVTLVAHDVGPVGGMERQLAELAAGLLARGVEVTVIARACELPDHPRLRRVRVPGPSRPFTLAYPWFLLAGSLLVRLRRRGVLHTTGAIVLNRADVSTVHFCHHAPAVACLRRASRPGTAHRLNAAIAPVLSRLGERLAYRPTRTRRLVAVSDGVAREVRTAFPLATVETVPNGVDAERFRPDPDARGALRAELGLGEDELVVLFVGGEWEAKGLPLAIQAVARVPGSTLLVLGRGDAARYGALAERAGAGPRTHFAGVRGDPERWYAAADVFVLPSAYESFSLAAHEAAAAGLPLLAARTSGLEELLEHGVNGWFVEREAEELARRLHELRDDPGRRRAMGEAARRAAGRRTWPAMVDAYLELYARNGR